MQIKALISSPDNINGETLEWQIEADEIIDATLRRELRSEWHQGHRIRVIYQGRILNAGDAWMPSTGGMLREGAVVHVYIRKALASDSAPRLRPPASDSAIWSTVSVLRVQRVLANEHPGAVFAVLICFTLSLIWYIKLSNPRMLDNVSTAILYGATAAMLLVVFDKLSRRVRSTTPN
eukprot:Protomagalhaensia_sp_Gyna_25__669@NODE_1312_length_1954_cov_57_483029_g1047_i0_p2_GENE_NODE_1312_length_1954_cov_57_483029_g1047_i0NODE_1312_length_1954_cov_57_483029_g1047_i0_p2_ORF_typecomplete_len178_score23_06DUF2407/PF10302_9/0_0037Rad60SLD_2/PF13881_6/0_0075DUF4234/PF14018_6/0_051DUF2953/PF11167_8/8_1e03DUF2953/PF11167_8/0_17ArAE_2_N/PF10337_9/0_14_NODE_1312_length_1954_cov_57_483029_g1047_i025558